MTNFGMLPLRRALSLRPAALDLHSPGFAAAPPDVQQSLAAVVSAFAVGYGAALERQEAWPTLSGVPHPLRGFAVEGAAMSSALLDLLTLSGGRRLRSLKADGECYVHLIHVGAGWAFARLHVRPWRGIGCAAPLLHWLAWDGWGFHQAYFHPRQVLERQLVERAARGTVRPIRDQGAGRALWFHAGAEPDRIASVITGFPPTRQPDLWAGIGLAAAYTGAQPAEVAEQLTARAGRCRDQVAQGAAFAAKAHDLSGGIPRESAAAIEALTGASAETAASWTDAAYATAVQEADTPAAYERWRALIRSAWRRQAGGVLR
jgi:enediyne biosynthesis protein E3